MSAALLDWASAGGPLESAQPSGDLCVVEPFAGGVLVALVDGLGHGPEAAGAARAAERVLRARAADDPVAIVQQCHEALRGTRGAVMTIASLRAPGELVWIGVGNVEAVLVRVRKDVPRGSVILRGGIVGHRLPPLRASTLEIAGGDTLVLATDGIRSAFTDGVAAGGSPRALAESILAAHRKGTDDALVVVARWEGS